MRGGQRSAEDEEEGDRCIPERTVNEVTYELRKRVTAVTGDEIPLVVMGETEPTTTLLGEWQLSITGRLIEGSLTGLGFTVGIVSRSL